MDRNRIAMVVTAAVLLGLFASLGAYKYLAEKGRMAEQARLQTVGIVVARDEIPLGSRIRANQVAIAPWPKGGYPSDAFFDVKGVVGKVARREFVRGEPIVGRKLISGEGEGILSLKIPPGMRAFTVRVNDVVGVGGFIVPDARVDVVVTTTAGPRGQEISKIVLENIRVLAVGPTVARAANAKPLEKAETAPSVVNTVTLAVTPEEAEKLALASTGGTIQLVLRNFADSEKVATKGITKRTLLSGVLTPQANPEARPRPTTRVRRKAPAPPRRHVVEVIRGNKRSEEVF